MYIYIHIWQCPEVCLLETVIIGRGTTDAKKLVWQARLNARWAHGALWAHRPIGPAGRGRGLPPVCFDVVGRRARLNLTLPYE